LISNQSPLNVVNAADWFQASAAV